MNNDNLASIIDEALNIMIELTKSSLSQDLDLAQAIKDGTYTEEQLDEFTRRAHSGMTDMYGGCMVEVINDLITLEVSHFVINHVIRTYVRKTDKVEQEAAK